MVRVFVLSFLAAAMPIRAEPTQAVPSNPLIDYRAFVRDVIDVQAVRQSRRVSEEAFIRMAQDPDTIVLDARSRRLFDLRHVRGAVNLTFPEFTADSLASVIPTYQTRVLIYCNNNFIGAPESFPTKTASSALNVSTFVSLYAYGYRNVYELGPMIDVMRTKIVFAGLEVS